MAVVVRGGAVVVRGGAGIAVVRAARVEPRVGTKAGRATRVETEVVMVE